MILHDGDIVLHHGDCLNVMQAMPADSVDAVVCDPPYGLEFMGKEWDGWDSVHAYQAWCQQWAAEALRVLKPGGMLLAFGGTRTSHRLASGIEDAGFEIRDSIVWMYGSGFPKSLDVGKAIDKRPGVSQHAEFASHLNERRLAAGLSTDDVAEHVVGTRSGACRNWEHHQFPEAKWWPALRDLLGMSHRWDSIIAEADREVLQERTMTQGGGTSLELRMGETREVRADITAPATPEAQQWDGWGTALKPASEPIIVARKPLSEGTVAANVLRWGTGGINVDACRVGTTDKLQKLDGSFSFAGSGGANETGKKIEKVDPGAGRWPPNVVLTHSADCDIVQCAAGCPVAELDAQSGITTTPLSVTRGGQRSGNSGLAELGRQDNMPCHGDTGGASRFFPTFRYQAKAGTAERPYEVDGEGRKIAHPTCKPLELMRWLCRLVLAPGATCLDPFAGSGTTGEACLLEGFKAILIEQDAEYIGLIEQRLSKPLQPGMF